MCSIAELEDVGPDIKETSKFCKKRNESKDIIKVKSPSEGGCMKCPEAAVVLVRNGDPLCKRCFMNYVVHKFRATIGKARVIRQGENVLLAVSGGSSSCAMLDLVVRGLDKEAAKKLRFQPGVVHIDEGELLGRNTDERIMVKQCIENLASAAGFPFYFVMLEDLFKGENEPSCLGVNFENLNLCNQTSDKRSNRLADLFSNVSTVTAKEDLLSHLYRYQLLKIAKDNGYDRVMVGDCSTSLSIRILSDVAQGRGSQLPFNISFEDARSKISVIRPLREFTKKEIEFYNCFNNVPTFIVPSFSTKADAHVSVNRLTQEFILGLQAAFPSTVRTVLRTGDKLSSNISTTHNGCCCICLAPLEFASNLSHDVNKGSELKSFEVSGSGNDCCNITGGGNGGYNGTGVDDGCFSIGDSDGCDIAGDDGGSVGYCGAGVGGECCHIGGSDGNGAAGGGCTGDTGDNSGYCGSDSNNSRGEQHCGKDVSGTVDVGKAVVSTLCYGCQLTYHDLKANYSLLPEFVMELALKTSRRTAMKEHIKEFLLDD